MEADKVNNSPNEDKMFEGIRDSIKKFNAISESLDKDRLTILGFILATSGIIVVQKPSIIAWDHGIITIIAVSLGVILHIIKKELDASGVRRELRLSEDRLYDGRFERVVEDMIGQLKPWDKELLKSALDQRKRSQSLSLTVNDSFGYMVDALVSVLIIGSVISLVASLLIGTN